MSIIPSEDDKKKPTGTTKPEAAKPAEPAKEVAPAKAEAKKAPERAEGPFSGFFFEYAKDRGYAGNRYQTNLTNGSISATPESQQTGSDIDAGVAFGKFRENGHTLVRIGAQIKDISNVLNDQRVYLTQTTGAPTSQTQLGEASVGSQLSKLHLIGGSVQVEHQVSAFLVGARVGGGSLKSELNTTAYQASATSGRTFGAQAFPATSTKRELGGTAGAFVGVQPIPRLPTIIGGADAIVSANVRATNLYLKAVQDIPLGNSGLAVTASVALNHRNGNITHDGSSMKISGHGLNPSGQVGLKWNVPTR